MHHTTIKIGKELYAAVTDGSLNHPQGVEKLVALLRLTDGVTVWKHNSLKGK